MLCSGTVLPPRHLLSRRARALRSSRRARQAGFTLTELMTVVVITGILAAIGTATFRKHIYSSKSGEVTSVIRAIAGAQERFRGETLLYMPVSGTTSANLTRYYPMGTPGLTKYHWDSAGSGNDYANWKRLGPAVPGPVQFGYATIAGGPGTPPQPSGLAANIPWGVVNDPWYIIQAAGDVDGDGVQSLFVAASFRGEVYREREGE
jgi:type IV pilus assembly protein PilA